MGRVYKELGEPLFSLYAENMACHTIHMDDVVGATWQATQWYGDKEKSGTVIFNLVDQGKTSKSLGYERSEGGDEKAIPYSSSPQHTVIS